MPTLADIPIVLLAGGRGTRLAEATRSIPKPMVEIGPKPILMHIMDHYAAFGARDFHIALGYKGDIIKRYFLDSARLHGSLSVDLATGQARPHGTTPRRDWQVHLIETGLDTATGGRVRAMRERLRDAPTIMATYGDGVSDVDLDALLAFHQEHGRIATLTAVRPPARFGAMMFDGPLVKQFTEKPQIGEGWINGGFLVFSPRVFDYLDSEQTSLEADALERLAADGELAAYRHDGFWQCMDTLRDVELLRDLWQRGDAPWITRRAGATPLIETTEATVRKPVGRS